MEEAEKLTCIVGSATVVGGGEEGDEVALCETLEAVHDTLMRPYNHLQLVVLQEALAKSGSRRTRLTNASTGALS